MRIRRRLGAAATGPARCRPCPVAVERRWQAGMMTGAEGGRPKRSSNPGIPLDFSQVSQRWLRWIRQAVNPFACGTQAKAAFEAGSAWRSSVMRRVTD